ncbi:P-loop containing nucleoside triphosphate hydrolase protein, partial [Ramicandelaber brevisporus]
MASADGDVPVESDGFSSSASQEAVFEATTLPLVRDLILGMRDGLLFAYGITSSGKSHSIQGTPSQPGLLPRTLKLITSWLNDKDGKHEYAVMVSYTEVYNDRVYDLLDIEQLATQANRVNNEDHYLEGVTEVRVRTIDEAMAVFESGQRNRAVYSTQLNSDSSRSHALFNIKLIRLHKDAILEPGKQIKSSYEQNASCRISQLTLVDLAGSERPDKTQASGNRLREAGKINQSLLDLGSVLQALRDNQYESDKRKHKLIPFRNSELTKLFKSPLTGGKAGVVMLVTVNPYDSSRNETRKVLDFSAVASSVFTIVNK